MRLLNYPKLTIAHLTKSRLMQYATRNFCNGEKIAVNNELSTIKMSLN